MSYKLKRLAVVTKKGLNNNEKFQSFLVNYNHKLIYQKLNEYGRTYALTISRSKSMNYLNFHPSYPNLFELFSIVINSTTTKPQSQTDKVGLITRFKNYHTKIIEINKKKIKFKVLLQGDLFFYINAILMYWHVPL